MKLMMQSLVYIVIIKYVIIIRDDDWLNFIQSDNTYLSKANNMLN